MELRPTQRKDMEGNHDRVARLKKKVSEPLAQPPWNVEVVLDLGNVTFFLFRGRPYGMPPLPWKAGQKLLAAWHVVTGTPNILTPETAPAYYEALQKIPPLLWANCYPQSRILRVLRWFGLVRNPFARATEYELAEYADFFLRRRTRPGVSSPLQRKAQRRSVGTP